MKIKKIKEFFKIEDPFDIIKHKLLLLKGEKEAIQEDLARNTTQTSNLKSKLKEIIDDIQ